MTPWTAACRAFLSFTVSGFAQTHVHRVHDAIQTTKIMTSGPITSWQIDGETMETVTDF